MVNEIRSGISKALYEEFGGDIRIYTEPVAQGFITPCFFIEKVSQSNALFLGNRYFRTHTFCIHYFGAKEMQNQMHGEILERLYECLEVISVEEDLYRCKSMSAEYSDGVLHFLVGFDAFVNKAKDGAKKMDKLVNRIRIKE